MTSDLPISEDDLQAYVDDALEPERREAVERHLAQYPEAAQRVRRFVEQRDQLREAFAPYASEPVPAELRVASLIAARRQRTIGGWRAMAAAAALVVIGGGGGWYGRALVDRPAVGVVALAQEASASFATFASDHGRPVEIKAEDSASLVSWASERLKRPVIAPDLTASGYRFMGGRLVPTSHGPAAMLMYDDDHGSRLVMLARPMTEKDVPMSEQSSGAVSGYAWAKDSMGYSLVGDIAPDVLHPIANEIRRQSEKI